MSGRRPGLHPGSEGVGNPTALTSPSVGQGCRWRTRLPPVERYGMKRAKSTRWGEWRWVGLNKYIYMRLQCNLWITPQLSEATATGERERERELSHLNLLSAVTSCAGFTLETSRGGFEVNVHHSQHNSFRTYRLNYYIADVRFGKWHLWWKRSYWITVPSIPL
jgi:hypothetical protein